MTVELSGLTLPLAHFTLELEAKLTARVTAIFGPSGSGKTSLLEIIAGLRKPKTGSVKIDGAILTDRATKRWVRPEQRQIGYVPQEGALFPHLSVRQNLSYGYRVSTPRPSALSFDHVVDVLEIRPSIERSVGSLSGGEKQRIALGRALLSSPKLLLLDEPLAGLDTDLKERLLPYLKLVREEFKIPMLYVTHSANEVMELCEDVIVLERGRILQHAPCGEVFTRVNSPQYRLRHYPESDRAL